MGFKLGRERGIQVDNGEIKNKMRFNKDDKGGKSSGLLGE